MQPQSLTVEGLRGSTERRTELGDLSLSRWPSPAPRSLALPPRLPRGPRSAPPHSETGVPPVLPGRLPLTGRLAYPSFVGIVQPDELLTLLRDGELGLGEVRQAALKAEKPV